MIAFIPFDVEASRTSPLRWYFFLTCVRLFSVNLYIPFSSYLVREHRVYKPERPGSGIARERLTRE